MRFIFRACVLSASVLASAPLWAARSIDEQRTADLRGAVQINSISGVVEVVGWDKPELEVTGELASADDSVEIGGDPAHLAVQVHQARSGGIFGGGIRGARLVVRLPAASSVVTTLVSADFKTQGVHGDMELHTVSGDARGEVGGNLKVTSVSGDIRLSAPAAHNLALKTVSGDIEVSGGDGETDVSTVSGSSHVSLGSQSRLHFKSTSGDVHLRLGLTRNAHVEGEALSGDVSVIFHDAPAADFDVETHSGEIDNCFGPKPVERGHGPGQRLTFRSAESDARVRIVTHSGDIELCTDNEGHR